jgi:hypothetical protein
MITKALHHHAIFLHTIISFLYTTFDIPFSINYFRLGFHSYRSIPFCLWWYWFDYSLLSTSLYLTATASIQRHMHTFNPQWLDTALYSIDYQSTVSILFYIIFMFLYPCTVYFDESEGWCAYPCYIDNTVLYKIDWVFNTILPVFIIV